MVMGLALLAENLPLMEREVTPLAENDDVLEVHIRLFILRLPRREPQLGNSFHLIFKPFNVIP